MDIKQAIIEIFQKDIESRVKYVNSLYEDKNYNNKYIFREEKQLEIMEQKLEDIKSGKEKIKKYYYMVENEVREEEHIKYYCRDFKYSLS